MDRRRVRRDRKLIASTVARRRSLIEAAQRVKGAEPSDAAPPPAEDAAAATA